MEWVGEGSSKKTKEDASVQKKKSDRGCGSKNHMLSENIPDYVSNVSKVAADHSLKIRFHHKGYFISDPMMAYIEGEVYESDKSWDIDEINLIDLKNEVLQIGVNGEYKLWYVTPGKEFRDGLKLLENDRDTIRFINEFKGESRADFYVETPNVDGLDCRYESDVEVVGEANEDDL